MPSLGLQAHRENAGNEMNNPNNPTPPADESGGDPNEAKRKVTIWTVIQSVLAAAVGVQTDANRQRDMEHVSPLVFIVAGILFLLLFMLIIGGIVALVLPD